MRKDHRHRAPLIHFSRWSRKGYAMFAALGKEVAISAVSIGICERALLKSARKGTIVSDAECAEYNPAGESGALREEQTFFPVYGGEVCADGNGTAEKRLKTGRGYAGAGISFFHTSI